MSVVKSCLPAAATDAPDARLPYAGPSAVLLALVAAVALCWPMLLTTAPLGYFDTAGYHSDGAAAVDVADRMLSRLLATGGVTGDVATTEGAVASERDPVVSIRSLPYSVFVYATSGTGLGLVLPVILQTAMTLYLLLALIPRPLPRDPLPVAAGMTFMGLATTLPWFASYAMPDILVAAIVLYFALLLGPVDLARGWQIAVFGLLGSFAVLSHYANPPLALALCCAVLGWRIVTRRLGMKVVALAIIPVLLPLPVNFAANVATDSGPSIAPKRLPLVLARSIADGPGKWYLEEACTTADYAICELFDEIPGNLGTFLWSTEGIKSATDAQLARIQAEEVEILIETMKTYPLQQTRALAGNAALQLVAVGTEQILPRRSEGAGIFPTATAEADAYPAIRFFDPIVRISSALGLAALLLLAARRTLPSHLAPAFVLLVLATLVNGALFGGLSAPVDRYQARFAWLFPAFAVIAWIELRGRLQADSGRQQ